MTVGVRAIDVVRAGTGFLDLVVPERIAKGEIGHAPSADLTAVYRILGARQLAQASVAATVGLRRGGVALDSLHLASMVATAVIGPARLRRWALVQTAGAAAFTVWGLISLERR